MKRSQGFTLIEMMIAVTIIAILAAIAMPSYQSYIRKARRSDGIDVLLNIQNMQERYRANNTSYGTLTEIGFTGTASLAGYYTVSIANDSATGYVATATAQGDQASDTDSGVTCAALTITVSTTYPRGFKGPVASVACW